MRLIWLISHITILLISTNLLWRIYSGPKGKKYLVYLLLIIFAPTFFILTIGHITTLHLLGLVGFLYFVKNAHRSRQNYFFAGASASLVLIKPQLLYLFLFAIIVWIIGKRNWLVLFGGAIMILILSLIPIIINPTVFIQYWDTLSNYEVGTWATPTIGMVLRLLVGIDYEWLQALPMIFGVAWFVIHWRQHRKKWDWLEELPLLLLICVVTAPYGWTYDMVVLLIPVISLSIEMMRIKFNWVTGLFFISYIFINMLALYMHSFLDDFWFFWYAPVLLIWYLFGKRIISRHDIQSSKNLQLDPSTNKI
jgi:hypothetical protein